MMKNWQPAELGSLVRAMERTPRACLRGLNSALSVVAGAAGAGAGGVAALDHEAGDDAVEDHAVVEASLREEDEAVDVLGGVLGVELRLILPSWCRSWRCKSCSGSIVIGGAAE